MTAPRVPLGVLDELEAALAKATPGVWTAATAPAEGSEETPAEYLTAALRPEEGRPLWVAWASKVDGVHGDDADYVVPIVTGDGPTSEANARFVAAAHAALPGLLADLRKHQAAIRAVAELADELGWLVQDETVDEVARVSHAWTLHRITAALSSALGAEGAGS